MKRITKAMVQQSGRRYCCVCKQLGPRVKAHWTHEGREYCDEHKPSPAPVPATRPNEPMCVSPLEVTK